MATDSHAPTAPSRRSEPAAPTTHGRADRAGVTSYFAGYFWFILKNVVGWIFILGSPVLGLAVPGPGGMGRLFQTTYIEPAGGSSWKAVVRRPKTEGEEWERTFEGADSFTATLQDQVYALLDALLPYPGWFELKYDPEAGALTLTRAMQSRRDVPTAERFALYLQTLEQAGAVNRAAQADAGVATAPS